MRVIESQMLAAIRERKSWKSRNTKVTFVGGHSFVYLHGHCIAVVGPEDFEVSHCGWTTPTTKSRLNAIIRSLCPVGHGIHAKSFVWYVTDSNGTVPMDYTHTFKRA